MNEWWRTPGYADEMSGLYVPNHPLAGQFRRTAANFPAAEFEDQMMADNRPMIPGGAFDNAEMIPPMLPPGSPPPGPARSAAGGGTAPAPVPPPTLPPIANMAAYDDLLRRVQGESVGPEPGGGIDMGLVLARIGAAMASSRQPGLLGAFGEGVGSGVQGIERQKVLGQQARLAHQQRQDRLRDRQLATELGVLGAKETAATRDEDRLSRETLRREELDARRQEAEENRKLRQAILAAQQGKPSDLAQMVIEAGYKPGTPEFQKQMQALINKKAGIGEGGGPFEGTSMDAQSYNILINPKSDPASPTYAAAWQHLSQPKTSFDASTGTMTTIMPDMSRFRPPADISAAPAATPPVAAPAPAGQPQAAPPQAGAPGVTQTPVAPPKMTDEQAKASGFADRMRDSMAVLDEDAVSKAAMSAGENIKSGVPLVGNYLVSSEYQKATQAQRNFINAMLRRESGAVISEEEFANARQQYFPQPGDSEAVLAQKKRNREQALTGMVRSAGPGYKPSEAAATSVPEPPPGFVKVQ